MKTDFINRMFVDGSIAITVLVGGLVAITRSALSVTVGTGVVGLFPTARLVWTVVSNP